MTEIANYTKAERMQNYIRGIRNEQERDYAIRYALWLLQDDSKQDMTEPGRGALSYMAAQAVRLNLHAIWEERQL